MVVTWHSAFENLTRYVIRTFFLSYIYGCASPMSFRWLVDSVLNLPSIILGHFKEGLDLCAGGGSSDLGWSLDCGSEDWKSKAASWSPRICSQYNL